jgi:mercuric ion transport protein
VIRRTLAAAGSAGIAAVGAALCCAGPLVAVALGLSGAGLAATFEPLRPYFIGATVIALGIGHWLLYREDQKACVPGTPCADVGTRRRLRGILWAVTAVSVLLVTFSWWFPLLA